MPVMESMNGMSLITSQSIGARLKLPRPAFYFPHNEFIASDLGAPKNLHPVKNSCIHITRVARSCHRMNQRYGGLMRKLICALLLSGVMASFASPPTQKDGTKTSHHKHKKHHKNKKA